MWLLGNSTGKGAGKREFPKYSSKQLDGKPRSAQTLEELVMDSFNWEILGAEAGLGLA